MDTSDPRHPRQRLWERICAIHGDATPTIQSVQRRAGVSQGTVQRIRDRDLSIGIDTLQQLAESYGREAWQMIAPEEAQPLSPDALVVAQMFDRLPANSFEELAARRWAFAAALRLFSIDSSSQPSAAAPSGSDVAKDPLRSVK